MFKGILVLAAMTGFSFSAFAAELAYPESYKVSYTIDTHLGGGDQVYYNCDSVESQTEDLLEKLGAEHVQVRCTGGFDPYSHFSGPAFVTAKFVAPTMTKNNATPRLASVKEVSVYEDCHFMTSTLDGISDVLAVNLVSGPNNCWDNQETQFKISALTFEN